MVARTRFLPALNCISETSSLRLLRACRSIWTDVAAFGGSSQHASLSQTLEGMDPIRGLQRRCYQQGMVHSQDTGKSLMNTS